MPSYKIYLLQNKEGKVLFGSPNNIGTLVYIVFVSINVENNMATHTSVFYPDLY